MIILGTLQAFAFLIVLAWPSSAMFLIVFFPNTEGLPYTAFHELRPLYLPSVVLFYLPPHPGWPVWLWVVGVVSSLLYWLVFKDVGGDDDRWKRRRRKAAGRITRSGSRLAVVPVQAGGRS